jgi:UDPglucose 6-dehydrogenase
MNKRVAIIGNGWVGNAMLDLFPYALVFIRDPNRIPNDQDTFTSDKDKINECDIAFICVPTPNIQEGRLDTSAVEECIQWLETPLIVIRSTVNPGDCDRWSKKYSKSIVFQPEYLGETPQHPLLNTAQTPFIILGGHKILTKLVIDLYTTVYNANVKIRQVTLEEAEIIKLSENRAIAFKVAQCQELYDVCHEADVDYYTVRDAVYGDDPRFTLWWTFVFPDERGFDSKCIPKDVYAWCAWAESLGYEPKITRALLEKNKEWIEL